VHATRPTLRDRRHADAGHLVAVDKAAIRELATELQHVIHRYTVGKTGPLGRRIFFQSMPQHIRGVDGSLRRVPVRLETLPTQDPDYIVSGGHDPDGRFVVVHVNGTMPAEVLRRGSVALMIDQLYNVLLHELTHAADINPGKRPSAKGPTWDTAGVTPRAYYNHPTEVRAHMQQVVDEIERRIGPWNWMRQRYGPTEALRRLMTESRTWVEIKPHLSERNKQLVIRAAAARVHAHEAAAPRAPAPR